MNTFVIGDKVIYPTQGIGIIENIQIENHYGENSQVYRLRILSNDSLILVPSANTEEIGIRKLASQKNIEKIFNFIRDGGVDVSKNWKGRYKEYVELMNSGLLKDMAFVLKSLYYLNLTKPLSFREKKMMEKARELLVAEISEVSDTPFGEIEKKVLDDLSNCFKNISPCVDV